jgi:hypothetical protein
MGKDKKSKDKKSGTLYQCGNCGGVSKDKKAVCKPGKVAKDELSKKELKKKPCSE